MLSFRVFSLSGRFATHSGPGVWTDLSLSLRHEYSASPLRVAQFNYQLLFFRQPFLFGMLKKLSFEVINPVYVDFT